MKVKELLAVLQNSDPEDEVLISTDEKFHGSFGTYFNSVSSIYKTMVFEHLAVNESYYPLTKWYINSNYQFKDTISTKLKAIILNTD